MKDYDRNREIVEYKNSFDYCIFEFPLFEVSGATKINDDSDVCIFSGISYSSIYNTIENNCIGFDDDFLSGNCLDYITWDFNVQEDGNVVNSLNFHSGFTLNNVLPTHTDFINAVEDSFDFLNYNYTIKPNDEYEIEKPFGVESQSLYISIDIAFNNDCLSTNSEYCGCPTGFTQTVGEDACIKSATTASTLNGNGFYTADTRPTNVNFGKDGGFFHENISDEPKPISFSANSNSFVNANDVEIDRLQVIENQLWGSGDTTTNGRLNNVGIWGSNIPSNEWVGFAECIDIPSTGHYTLGLAADNWFKFSINGDEILNFTVTDTDAFNRWWVVETTLNSGKNIIEMEGYDSGGVAASFGAEIYSVTVNELTGITTESELSAVTVFTTENKLGEEFELGEASGYTCPSGYALNACENNNCVDIDKLEVSCEFSGSTCSGDTLYTACTTSYSAITSANTAVHYYMNSSTDTIDFTFNFVNNISSFDDSTVFKYRIYKLNEKGAFDSRPNFRSDSFLYSTFKDTNSLDSTVFVRDLIEEGEYLIKGFYAYDVCTEFGSILGLRNDTSSFISGDEYGIYDKKFDYYFILFNYAVPPIFSTVSPTDREAGRLRVATLIPEDDGVTSVAYGDPLNNAYIALNGLILSKGNDYTLNVMDNSTVINFSDKVYTTDVISVVYVAPGDDMPKIDTYRISTPIPQGGTGQQGDNDVFYNTDENKYEVYTTLNPTNNNDISVTLNGVTLTRNIDYYQSISNPKRVILEGNLSDDDVVNVIYHTNEDVIDGVYTNNPIITWTITDQEVINDDGEFYVEVARDDKFNNVIYSNTVNYEENRESYSDTLTVTGSLNETLYYRVKNIKKYITIKGSIIKDIKESEVVPIQIRSNAINSY